MPETFPALLAKLLRADESRPLVTFYDDATGERVELSVATYANWVAKTSSLFVEELDLERGDRILLDLPTHWLGPVFLGAAWNAGLVVCFPDDAAEDAGEAGAVVCGPDGLTSYAARAGGLPVLATALLPLGVRFADPLPAGVRDFGIEVWTQPDSFVPFDPPEPPDPALADGRTQQQVSAPSGDELEDRLGSGGRLLTSANPASTAGLPGFLAPLVTGGSVVWVRHPGPDSWQRRYCDERASAEWAG